MMMIMKVLILDGEPDLNQMQILLLRPKVNVYHVADTLNVFRGKQNLRELLLIS